MAKIFMVLVWIILILPILIGVIANANHWFSFVFIALSSLCFVSMLRPIPQLRLDKPLKGFVAGSIILLAGAIADGSFRTQSTSIASNNSCEFGIPHSGRYYVRGDKINFRTGPGTSYEKVVNERASAALKKTNYQTLWNSQVISAKCKFHNWIQGQIIEADGRAVNWETGWVLSKFLSTEKTQEEKSGLVWNFDADEELTDQEKKILKAGALKTLKEDSNCGKITYGFRSSVTQGSFYVTCIGKYTRPGISYSVTFKDPQAISTKDQPKTPHTTNNGKKSETRNMPFEACLLIIRDFASDFGQTPINITETNDLRVVKFPSADGSVQVSCSRPDQKMTIIKNNE